MPTDWPYIHEDKEIQEILIAGRWIRIKKGSYYEDLTPGGAIVLFQSEDGKHHYETSVKQIQMKVFHVT